MRKINEIIIHCTGDNFGVDHDLKYYDKIHRERGFKCCGYHYLIHSDGRIEGARPLSSVGAHCKGHNSNSIGIAYIGGMLGNLSCNTLTRPQSISLAKLLYTLIQSFGLSYDCIKLHNEYSNKSCPSFSRSWFDHVYKDILINPLTF